MSNKCAYFVIGLLLLGASAGWSQVSITSFSPLTGPVGTDVTITGGGFDPVPANNIVFFGPVRAAVKEASSTSLTVVVPAGATYDVISVLAQGLMAWSNARFMVSFPNDGTGINENTFASQVNLAEGQNVATIFADFDGDGKPDLAGVNVDAGTFSVLLNNSEVPGSIVFGAPVSAPVGIGVNSIAAEDLDGDGRQDVIIVNHGPSLSVFRNTSMGPGSITFADPVDFQLIAQSTVTAIADLNADGKGDIVVANPSSGSLSLLRNTSSGPGSISFATKEDLSAGEFVFRVCIGDLDGDDQPDLAALAYRKISILRNNNSAPGSLSFFDNVEINIGGDPSGLTIAEVDGDGKLDLVVSNRPDADVSVFRNTTVGPGPVSFAERQDFATGTNPGLLSQADFDGDGRVDLVVANSGSGSFTTLKNESTPGLISFAAKKDFSGLAFPAHLVVGDADVDGKPDVVLVNSTGQSVFRNTTSSPPRITSLSSYAGAKGSEVRIQGGYFHPTPSDNVVFFGATRAEVTSASLSELVVTVPAGATYAPVTVMANNLTAYSSKPFVPTFPSGGVVDENSFAPKVDFDIGSGIPFDLLLGDLDGDGKSDLIVTNLPYSLVNLYRNTSTPGVISTSSFATKVDLNAYLPAMAAFGDLDGDGKPDVAVANQETGTVAVFHNTSTEGSITTESFAEAVDLPAGLYAYGIAIEDLDGDGKPDIVVTTSADPTVSVLRNISVPGSITADSFEPKVDFTTGEQSHDVAICDIDGDGKRDLVVISGEDNIVSVFKNNIVAPGTMSVNSFAERKDFDAGNYPIGLAVGDVDDDGKPDLVITAEFDNSISVLKNTSVSGIIDENTFAPKVDLPVGDDPRNATLGDVDGDGKLDIVVPNNFSEVTVIKNISIPGILNENSFASGVDFPAGHEAYNATIGDVDGDGRPEVVVTNFNMNSVSVYRNTIVLGPEPTLDSFSPLRAEAGATVTITGTNFNYIATNNTVNFNGVRATVTSCTGTSITTVVPSGATTGPLTVTVGAQKATGADFVVAPPPFITAFDPHSARLGETIVISGTDFDPVPGENIVKINGVVATVIEGSATSISVSVPEGSTSGKITLTADGLTTTSASNFILIPGPSITGFDPALGIEGTSVTITGTNFHSTPSNNIVKFNTTNAVVTASNESSVTVTVPVAAVTGKITVTIGTQTATSATDFVVLPKPSITALDPSSGLEGAVIVIMGTNFDATPANNTVSFNGTNAVVTESTTTTITTRVPAGATTGPVSVTVNGVTGVSAGDFTVKVDTTPPVVTDGTESSVAPGAAITISAQITDPETAITNAVVEYRSMAAGGDMTIVPLTAGGSTYTSQVPGAQVGELGIEYRIKATSKGGEYRSPVRTVQLVNATGVQIPYASFGKDQSNYRIIAIPLDLTEKGLGKVFDELGTYDKTKWRMYRYNIGQTAELNIGTQVLPGFGYWLIAKDDPGVAIRSGAGKTVQAATDEPFEIDLRADWNQIGNPYDFNISWEDVQAANPGLPGLRIFNGEFADGAILNRMEGGFVKVATAQKLRFPVVKNPGVQAGRGKHETGGFTNPLDGNNWQVYFTIEQGGLSNRISGFGMNKKASEGFDPLDRFNMPRFFDHSIHLNHSKKEGEDFYSSDIVPPANEYEWNFEIVASDEGTPVTLSWDNSYFGNRGPDLYLWDESLHRAIDMRAEDHYMFHPDMSSTFRVLYGPPSFVEERTRVDNLTLHAAWPVPVDDYFTVSLSLPDSPQKRAVNVVVFDLVGRSVLAAESRLAGGYHEIGLARTAQMRAGIYLLNVSDGRATRVKRIVFK